MAERASKPSAARTPPGVAGLTLPTNAEVMEQVRLRGEGRAALLAVKGFAGISAESGPGPGFTCSSLAAGALVRTTGKL